MWDGVVLYEWGRLIWWSGQNAGAIQALSAVATVLLTILLAVFTVKSVKAAEKGLRVAQGGLQASLHPQLLPSIRVHWFGDEAKLEMTLKNVGEVYFQLKQVYVEYYCSMSEQTQARPIEFPLLTYRVLASGEEVAVSADVNPREHCYHHEEHEGECKWVFRADLKVEDLVGRGEHHYYYDTSLGLRYFRDFTVEVSLVRKYRYMLSNKYGVGKIRLKKAWKINAPQGLQDLVNKAFSSK